MTETDYYIWKLIYTFWPLFLLMIAQLCHMSYLWGHANGLRFALRAFQKARQGSLWCTYKTDEELKEQK